MICLSYFLVFFDSFIFFFWNEDFHVTVSMFTWRKCVSLDGIWFLISVSSYLFLEYKIVNPVMVACTCKGRIQAIEETESL